jgi:hypothetical protein
MPTFAIIVPIRDLHTDAGKVSQFGACWSVSFHALVIAKSYCGRACKIARNFSGSQNRSNSRDHIAFQIARCSDDSSTGESALSSPPPALRGIVSRGSAFITIFSIQVPEIDGLVTNVPIQINIALEADWVFT